MKTKTPKLDCSQAAALLVAFTSDEYPKALTRYKPKKAVKRDFKR